MTKKMRKDTILKKILVFLLVFCMVASDFSAVSAFAQTGTEEETADTTDTTDTAADAEEALDTETETDAAVQAEVSDSESVTETTASEQETEEIAGTEDSAEASDSSDVTDSAETTDSTDSESSEESSDSEVTAEDILLEYVAVESSYVEVGETQTIVISFENGEAIEVVTLSYHRESDGTSYTVSASDQEDGAFSFEIAYTSDDEVGVYVLDSVAYTVDGVTVELVLSEIGIDAQYGVEVAADTDPDAVVVDEEEETEVEISIASFDEEGNLVSENSIEEALAAVSASSSSSSNVVVVLDPGHDSTHAGASANGLKEEELTLKIAEYCKAELEEYAGVTVYMTRDSEDCPYPGTTSTECNASRVEYAASVGADVYVSIHLNSSTSSSASGVEIYYPNSNYNSSIGEEGSALAEAVLEELVALGLTNRGTKIRNSEDNTTYDDGSLADYYGVIRRSKIAGFPAIIIEHAFLTNSSDAAYLKSESNLKALGVADATGIANYFGLSKSTTVYGGVDYAAVFDFDYYMENYPELAEEFGDDEYAALVYFVNYGMAECQQASADFDVMSYYYKYQDLRLAFRQNWVSYYKHYIAYGLKEGRTATGVTELQNPVTTYDGVDYSAVYDYYYYIDAYADIMNAYGGDDIAVLNHFVSYGMKEARQAIETFDVKSYYNKYQDLRLAYRKNWVSYYKHYIAYGLKEGRTAVGVTELQNPVTTYDGVDYSAVYDYYYYIDAYADIMNAYGGDDIAVLNHFVSYGMKEARQAIETFDVKSYYNKYQDLRLAYRKNWVSYYKHYIAYGLKEGRTATGVTELQNPVTTYDGVDYSAVYDYYYYIDAYADIMKAYGGDDIAVLNHFVSYGMKEGRQASATFNVQMYMSNYKDLQEAFGSTLKSYYLHYIAYGQKEGRNAVTSLVAIMRSTPSATVAQMVAYFNASGYEYPDYYSDTEAPTIEDLCQIYYDEAVTEGVDPAVAFCQAMVETNWLQFTGDVDISQYNFGGIGATGDGEAGNSFSSVTIGIRAQIQHLKAYASTDDLVNDCVDPRFSYVTRGCVFYVDELGSGYWATDEDYGASIKQMVLTLMEY